MWYNECIEKLWCYWVLNDFGRKLPYALSTYPKPQFLTIVHTPTLTPHTTPTALTLTPTTPTSTSAPKTHTTQTHTPSPAS